MQKKIFVHVIKNRVVVHIHHQIRIAQEKTVLAFPNFSVIDLAISTMFFYYRCFVCDRDLSYTYPKGQNNNDYSTHCLIIFFSYQEERSS